MARFHDNAISNHKIIDIHGSASTADPVVRSTAATEEGLWHSMIYTVHLRVIYLEQPHRADFWNRGEELKGLIWV